MRRAAGRIRRANSHLCECSRRGTVATATVRPFRHVATIAPGHNRLATTRSFSLLRFTDIDDELMSEEDGVKWATLNDDERAAWGTLGWTETSWDLGLDPPAQEEFYWNQLTEYQQEAARTLGYNAHSWNRDDAYLCSEISEDEVVPTVNMAWDQIDPASQADWQTLGWNQEIWETGGGSEPDISDYAWDALSPEQQEAARRLGYDDILWTFA